MQEDLVLSNTVNAVPDRTVIATPPLGQPGAAQSTDTLGRILSSLEQDKAEEVISIDLRGRSEIADYMVIASGRSSRQVAALSEKLTERLKASQGLICKIEGKEQGDWVLIDAGDVIVHVFRPEVRDFYQLEKMWQPTGAGQA